MADRLTRGEQAYAIKTWRYLRLTMVALVGGLIVSVFYEWVEVSPDCFQTSISAYYYTPVQGYFVGALVAIGVCLFCLKGSTDTEDTLLNLAGVFALVVAFVPTPDTGGCASLLGTAHDRDVNVENNVTALIVVGGAGLVVLAAMARRNPPTTKERVGYAVAAAVWVVSTAVSVLDRDLFVDHAHNVAAVLMFLSIVAVVWVNALGYRDKTRAESPRNRYAAIGVAMVVSLVVVGGAGLRGYDHWIIVIEFLFITLFAVFWLIQTIELWSEGLRQPTAAQ